MRDLIIGSQNIFSIIEIFKSICLKICLINLTFDDNLIDIKFTIISLYKYNLNKRTDKKIVAFVSIPFLFYQFSSKNHLFF